MPWWTGALDPTGFENTKPYLFAMWPAGVDTAGGNSSISSTNIFQLGACIRPVAVACVDKTVCVTQCFNIVVFSYEQTCDATTITGAVGVANHIASMTCRTCPKLTRDTSSPISHLRRSRKILDEDLHSWPEMATFTGKKCFRETFAEPSLCMILQTSSCIKRKQERVRERERDRDKQTARGDRARERQRERERRVRRSVR